MRKWGIISIFILAAMLFADVIDDMAVNQWYEAPDSPMSSVCYYTNSYWCGSVQGAWSGGAYDTKRDRLIVWGGGHGDSPDNSVYVFDVNTRTWSRASEASAYDQAGTETYSDGNPRSVHSYGSLQYSPAVDRFLAFGIRGPYPGVGYYKTVWSFDFNDTTWERYDTIESGGTGHNFTDIDRTTGKVWFHSDGSWTSGLWEYEPVSRTWTQRSRSTWITGDMAIAVDPERKKVVKIGGGVALIWDISNDADNGIKVDTLNAGGANSIVGASRPGFQYDPVLKQFVAWSGGQDVFFLDLDANTWTKKTGTDANPGDPTSTGTAGRFRYVPSKNVYVLANGSSKNVFFYRASAGQGTRTTVRPQSNGMAITVNPNPFNSKVKINYELQITNYELKEIDLSIYDINGKRMVNFTDKIHNSSFVICNSSAWPAGVYIARVTLGGKTWSKRLFLVR